MPEHSPFEKPLSKKEQFYRAGPDLTKDSEKAALAAEEVDAEVLDIDDRDVRSDHGLIDNEQLFKLLNDREAEQIVEEILGTLTLREEKIVRMYFGIGTKSESMTLKEIGDVDGVSVERVRQILAKALRKLKHWSRAERLVPLMDGMEEYKNYARSMRKNEKLHRKSLEDTVIERIKNIVSYTEKIAHLERLIEDRRQILTASPQSRLRSVTQSQIYARDSYLQFLSGFKEKLEKERTSFPEETDGDSVESILPREESHVSEGSSVQDVSSKTEINQKKMKSDEEKKRAKKEKKKKKIKEKEARETKTRDIAARVEKELKNFSSFEEKLEHVNQLIEFYEWEVRKNRSTKISTPLPELYTRDPVLQHMYTLRNKLQKTDPLEIESPTLEANS